MKTIQSYVTYLNGYLDVSIKSLPVNSKVRRYIDYLRDQNYENINTMKRLNKALDKCYWPTNLEPGTVGAFLFGCRQSSYGDVNRECSPLCIESLPCDNHNSVCDQQVWSLNNIQGEDRLVLIQDNSDSSQAYIYVGDRFDGLSSNELRQLKDHGVGNVSLYTTENSKHWAMSRNLSINKIPRKMKTPRRSFSLRSLGSEMLEEKASSKLIFFVIIIVIIVILVIIFSRSGK